MTASTAIAALPEPDLVVRREGVAGVIRLNRPKALNALTLEMTREIVAALDSFEADPLVSLILLEGAGERGLCAGGDIVVAAGGLQSFALEVMDLVDDGIALALVIDDSCEVLAIGLTEPLSALDGGLRQPAHENGELIVVR